MLDDVLFVCLFISLTILLSIVMTKKQVKKYLKIASLLELLTLCIFAGLHYFMPGFEINITLVFVIGIITIANVVSLTWR